MTKQNWIITAIAATVFIVGVWIGSSTEVKFGRCGCCHECSAIGLYWPCHECKPEPKPEPVKPVQPKPGRGATLGSEAP